MHGLGLFVTSHACCCAAQYLVSDGDAPRLTPSIPAIIYHFNHAAVGWKTGKMEVKGKQDMAQLLPRVHATMAYATDALFDNTTAMAAVQVCCACER